MVSLATLKAAPPLIAWSNPAHRAAAEETSGAGQVLAGQDLSKRFWATQALNQVSFRVGRGEILGLVGENGAGKSTLLNILSGCERPDSGRLTLNGREIAPRSYHEANELGIFRIFQELSLIPNLPVYENVFLSHESRFTRFGVVRKELMASRAAELFAELGHSWIDVRRPAGSYDFATRQAIEIVKAFALARLLNVRSPVLLLDEPTAALGRDEIASFYRLIEAVRDRAIMIFVSHRLTEVMELCQSLLILKDGRVVAERANDAIAEGDLHQLMVGRIRDEQFYKERDQGGPRERVRLRVAGLRGPGFAGINFALREGEILGLAGVMGSGKAELARAVAGIVAPDGGSIEVDGSPVGRVGIGAMLERRVGYVTPDRGAEGIFPGLPVAWNISIASLAASTGPLIGLAREQRQALEQIQKLRIKTAGSGAQARSLSGGNQQKVLMARWLAFEVKVLVLDNPTRGVDAGAKEEIYELLRELAAAGAALLLASDDLLEVIGLSDRLLVMKDGRIVEEIASPPEKKPSEAELVVAMV